MKLHYIELLGRQHPLCFSLAASEDVEAEFGSMKAMFDEMTSGDAARVAKATDKVLRILMKAGRVYASACGEEVPPPLPCRPADVIDAGNREEISKVTTAIIDAIRGDTARTVETQRKNGEATPGN